MAFRREHTARTTGARAWPEVPPTSSASILAAFGLILLLSIGRQPGLLRHRRASPTPTSTSDKFIGFETNGWTAWITIAAGVLLLFGAAQHALAKALQPRRRPRARRLRPDRLHRRRRARACCRQLGDRARLGHRRRPADPERARTARRRRGPRGRRRDRDRDRHREPWSTVIATASTIATSIAGRSSTATATASTTGRSAARRD